MLIKGHVALVVFHHRFEIIKVGLSLFISVVIPLKNVCTVLKVWWRVAMVWHTWFSVEICVIWETVQT